MEIPHSWAFDRPGMRVWPFRDTHGMVSVICGLALTCCPR
jgi:hypothetical protein